MPGQINFEFSFASTPSAPRSSGQAFRILLLGNFSGTRAAEQPLAERRIRRIDIDNFDQVLAAIAPEVQLHSPECTINFRELDDFHPDQLYRRLAIFEDLRKLRQRLQDPATAAQAIAAMSSPSVPPANADNATQPAQSDSLFEQLMGGSVAGAQGAHTVSATTATADTALLDGFIRSAVADHIVTTPNIEAYLNALDLAQADTLRAILHNPSWQALEANWQGLWWLVSQLITDDELSLHLLDMDFNEFENDLAAADGEPAQTRLYQRISERHGADSEPWTLIVALHEWPASLQALEPLAALTAIAKSGGSTLLSAAAPGFLGARDFATTAHPTQWAETESDFQTAWDSFRRSSLSSALGLALPRLLIRLPYGAADSIESFHFEEQTALPEHERFLWANPALACTLVIGRYFLDTEWAMTQRLGLNAQIDIDDMPAYTYKQDGESQLQAIAETYLPESAALKISQQGLIPMLSFRHRNAIRVGGLYSCSKEQRGLLEQL